MKNKIAQIDKEIKFKEILSNMNTSDEMSNLYRGPSIDASYQVLRWTTSDGKSSHCLWQGELKNLYYDDYENNN
jgi:hypothetical protein